MKSGYAPARSAPHTGVAATAASEAATDIGEIAGTGGIGDDHDGLTIMAGVGEHFARQRQPLSTEGYSCERLMAEAQLGTKDPGVLKARVLAKLRVP
jgi:hypothetical protein